MAHQLEALRRMENRRTYALFMEQGTGKTWTLLADVERLYLAGKIDAVLVLAPKGVHRNWIDREIPAHMEAEVIARAWRSGGGKKVRAHIDQIMTPREHGAVVPLRVMSMNFEAVLTKEGYAFAQSFLRATKAIMILDESTRIKNPAAARTKQIMKLRHMATGARIATGTPVTNAPVDIFSQMEFLASGLLGTTSYRAFVAEYAELLNPNHPLMKNIQQRNPRAAAAQIIAKNADGSPKWRNLHKLQELLEPHSYRVLKKDCLDLPDKIYKTHPFEIDAAQRKAYELMRDDLRIQIEGGEIAPVNALAALVKLQQITSGFVILPGTTELQVVGDGNPRLDALDDLVEDLSGQFIVWARFRQEIVHVAARLRKLGLRVAEYHGGVNTADREEAVDGFQRGEVDVFVGQPQSGGIGLTLTNAETVIYYSNDFNLETRLQSEDRAHRIGTKKNVVYIDLIAAETIDESIVRALQRKTDVAANVLGDLRA